MRKYEILYILRPDLDDEALEASVEKFSQLVVAEGGTIDNIDKWGKRKLAYEIEDFREGYYVIMYIDADTDLPQELERNFRISDDVIRYMTIRKSDL